MIKHTPLVWPVQELHARPGAAAHIVIEPCKHAVQLCSQLSPHCMRIQPDLHKTGCGFFRKGTGEKCVSKQICEPNLHTGVF